MKIETTGYVPPVSTASTAVNRKESTEAKGKDMFVVAPSLNKTGNITLADFNAYMEDFSELDRVAKEIKEKQDAIKEIVREGLDTLGMESVKTKYGTFSMVKEGKSTTFDAKKLKEEIPVIYDMYVKTGVKKAYLRVTPKK